MKKAFMQTIRQLRKHVEQHMQKGDAVILFRGQPKPQPAESVRQSNPQLEQMQQLAQEVKACTRCTLAQTRKRVVFGEGDLRARLVFVGEAPGAEEDREGKPFVGEAGKLLTRIIESIGLKREQVYLCNVLKCRTPGNRNPNPTEIATCREHLIQQLSALRPEVICVLGTFAAQTLLDTLEPIGQLRGKTYTYLGIPVVPTFHPAALLYHPQNKKLAWEDMKIVAKLLGLTIPTHKKQTD